MASTTGKNRSILAGLVGADSVTDTPTILGKPTSPERLTTRLTGLARVTAGDVREKTLKLVDPGRCRMWSRHNRRYDLLNETACGDLLESLRAQGEQEFPAIVRRVHDDPAFDFEVVCGARRHWSVSYLRNIEHRDIRFLIEERELSDEAAFRLADVENRSRRDICDFERAMDYRNAVETYYGGLAVRMAERLEVSKGWLSRFLDLAKLPSEVIDAFGDVRQLREHHAREIKPLLANTAMRPKVMAEAKRIAALQVSASERGEGLLDGPKVLTALKRAAAGVQRESPKGSTRPSSITNEAGATLFTLTSKGPRKVVLELALNAKATNEEFQIAFQRELDRLRPPP
jgi:ParB family chromosome partitioning protein